jgi:trimeric autotransporter adhesin
MFLKTTLVVVTIVFLTTTIHAQNTFPTTGAAGIGTLTPNASALLEIKSTKKGFLPPRMSMANRDLIASPVTGLLIYQTDNTPGLYYFDGVVWKPVDAGITETDPQVGSNTTNKIPKWNGTSLVTGSVYDAGGRIAVGSNATFQYRIYATAFASGDGIGLKGNSAMRGESNGHANGYLGVADPSYIYPSVVVGIGGFPDKSLLHIGGLGVKEPDTLQGAGLYGWNRGGAAINYGVKGIATYSSGDNYGVYGAAFPDFGATNGTSYGLYGSAVTIANHVGYGIYATATGSGINEAGYFGGHVKIVDDNEALTVSGTDPYIQLDEAGINTGYLRAKDGNLLLSINSANSSGNLQFLTRNKPRMWIDGSGRVSISDDGKIKEGYLLNIKGKMVAEEVLVQLNGAWPDYVFNKDYKLMQLTELKKYISQNDHLPEVPPADEMKNGISVGDMNKLLMQKVEELTLYVIQLNEEIQTLKANDVNEHPTKKMPHE